MNLGLKQNFPSTKILANWMGWFQKTGGKHVAGVCQSDDPRTVRNQIAMAKQVGIDGFVVDWYGPNDNPSHQATLELMVASESLVNPFEFSIMLDSGIFKWASTDPVVRLQILHSTIDYALSNLAVSPAYTLLNGKPLFWEFGLRENGIDIAALAKAYPQIALVSQNNMPAPGALDGTYAWVNGFPDNGVGYLAGYLASNPGGVKIPCLFWQFDDHDPKAPANSIWGGPARFISPRNGDMWTDAVKMVAATNPTILQVCTWNDYEEDTGIEKIVKALTGTKLY